MGVQRELGECRVAGAHSPPPLSDEEKAFWLSMDDNTFSMAPRLSQSQRGKLQHGRRFKAAGQSPTADGAGAPRSVRSV